MAGSLAKTKLNGYIWQEIFKTFAKKTSLKFIRQALCLICPGQFTFMLFLQVRGKKKGEMFLPLLIKKLKEQNLKIFLGLFFVFLLVFTLPQTAQAASNLVLSGSQKTLGYETINIEGRTMVPLRAVSEGLGYRCIWQANTREAFISGPGKDVIIMPNKKELVANGVSVAIDVAAKIIDDRLWVPVRAVTENLGANVYWYESTQIVYIESKSTQNVGDLVVTESIVNIYSGPDVNCLILGTAKQGQYLTQTSPEGDAWVQVAGGWVMASNVRACDQISAAARSGTANPSTETVTKNNILQGYCVVLDAGHGSIQPGGWTDPGAVGASGLCERDVVLEIAKYAKQILEVQGAKVILTRTTASTSLTLSQRTKIANDAGADVFVSIHINANINKNIAGTATYYHSTSWHKGIDIALAKCLQKNLVAALSLRNIGVLPQELSVLRSANMPAALVEVAFISNAAEENLLKQSWSKKAAASGIAEGIVEYLSSK